MTFGKQGIKAVLFVLHTTTHPGLPGVLPWGEEIWPNGTEVQEQLFGNLEQLRQMTMYITEAGLSI
jgi:hypothetical protein